MRRIELFRTNTGWECAQFDEDGRPCIEIIRLFGSHILPTAFTARAPAALVLGEITRLNPEHTVVLREGEKQ